MSKSVPGRSFDSGFAVGSNIVTPIRNYEFSAVIATPILQGCFLFFYAVLEVVADQTIFGLLTACTKMQKHNKEVVAKQTLHKNSWYI